ncbi:MULTISPECIES: alpha,alpha-phosphotrehalase [Thermoactinomyces]|jgi:trehalose-6-phosphate hydrolase|uniref:Alpha,alpha-phosphotrehalase n=1 Tax=Thermoactinomyces daqus TaxID=1329516 RepID=A0A7W1XD09_9BACL|nr:MULTISPECIES: alpha,alpha-phosphotrehalase [Thermoactinomyces]MBA4544415.1 alpha,alpha-phosphotrehalase [Thermoactinomyces daqus]MBH8598190.1 alpha,alpha-phosphotrehalase [Thermoactinomyces sp. CICC 10523]MBH8603219.1 alpha,alpha-phosphotrehalase [Thermoactinomyces sp. CICC 10522]MBH8608625.1 alpha,alpha-phosphotrehalase [Thermoactinomyces sp. CICC 10521]
MKQPWWKQAVVYQIYPKSFYDSNGDGIGDLQGIIEKLDYLHTLGVDVIWLTPIYESPQRDNGYDISDYFKINPAYGTMETFERLLRLAHEKGMKVILDMVVNHTSTEHPWFKEAVRSKDNACRHFYIWKDGKDGGAPNNWRSKFGGSAWQFSEETGQYYLHLYDVTQADLNWENEELRRRIYEMMRFWVNKGVDGFRLDVINLISKDQSFRDDTLETPMDDGRRFYTDGPRVHEFLKEMNREVFADNPEMMTVGEMSSTTIENCVRYTNPQEKELNMTFNFHHLKVDYPGGEKWALGEFDFLCLKKIFRDWQIGMHKGGGWNALFWCNHDQPRVVSRFGDDGKYRKESAKMLATAIHLMQGTPYIYQGEEIGMTNPGFSRIEEYRDVESLNAYRALRAQGKTDQEAIAVLKQKSRDNSRTPMQWNSGKHAGFSTGTPWIGVAPNYEQINVEEALQDPDSVFYHYQKLIRLRKEVDLIVTGDFTLLLEDHPQIFAYVRRDGDRALLVVNNFSAQETTFSLPEGVHLPGQSSVLIANYPDPPQEVYAFALRPYESVAFYLH